MTNEQIDALIRRVDVASTPDPGFVSGSYVELVGRVRQARRLDRSWFGRVRRDVRALRTESPRRPESRSFSLVGLVLLLLLALVAGLFVVGALLRLKPLGNGPLIVSVQGQLQAIDPVTGTRQPILPIDEHVEGVSRSPDGQIATFWTMSGGRSRLYAIGVDGRDRRELAPDLVLVGNLAIDTWSWDSRRLATEVTLTGISRILVVDVKTGAATPITPPGLVAHNPLWSPDGQWVAFTPETSTGRGLSLIRPDGTGLHDVAGDLHGLDVSGPDTWSPDGRWIYFDAGDQRESHVFRANVAGGSSQQLTAPELRAYANASSPDGATLAFIVDAAYGFDLWVADSDGRQAHRILAATGLGGWSSDGQLILVRWKPAENALGGLGTVRPDGTDLRILVPFDASCRNGWDETCELGFGWGQARP